MYFKNLPVIAKVMSLLILLGTIAIGGSILSAMQMRSTADAFYRLNQGQERAVQRFLQADRQIVWVERSIIQNIWALNDADNAKYLADTQKGQADFLAALAGAKAAFPDAAPMIDGYLARFEDLMANTCAKAIEMANAATTLEADSKAFDEMNRACEPGLTKLATDISQSGRAMVEAAERHSLALANTANVNGLMNAGIVIAGLFVTMILAGCAIGFGVVRPIRRLIAVMQTMTEGHLDVAVPGTERSDELGSMAKSVETFRASLLQTGEMRRQQEAERRAETALVARRNAEGEAFISRMSDLANGFSQAAGNVGDAARNLSDTAEDVSRQVRAVSGASDEASTNVQTVAAATEEMSVSIRAIEAQVSVATGISQAASDEAARIETEVRALAEAAAKIDEVVALISSIASQTNLLALNATIEAARAGDMGRGFAIVAHEVKQLAAQTAKATEDIGSRIADIQHATDRTVGSIGRIVGTISHIREISTTIASAVDQQGAATGEIAHNTQPAAQGTETVTTSITDVGRAAERTGEASTQLMELSSGLTDQAARLQSEVAAFVRKLRA